MSPMEIFVVALVAILLGMLVTPLWNSTVGGVSASFKVV